MDETRDDEILRRLDALVRLQAMDMTRDLKTVEKIRLLWRAGLDRRMIAELAGTNPDAVSVRISEFKRGAKEAAGAKQAPARKSSATGSVEADTPNE